MTPSVRARIATEDQQICGGGITSFAILDA
jgi:hypothetical protein